MKILILVICALVIANMVSGDLPKGCYPAPDPRCTGDPSNPYGTPPFWVPEEACKECLARNFDQYVNDPCDLYVYYHCDYVKGYVTAHKQKCLDSCMCFSTDTWTCEQTSACPTEAPFTEDVGHENIYCYIIGQGPAGPYINIYSEAADPRQYITYDWYVNGFPFNMPCPPGTYFNFTQCRCINCGDFRPCAGADPKVFTFDYEGLGNEHGVWYDLAPSPAAQIVSINSGGKVLLLDGLSGTSEVPFFENNEFSQFTIGGHFNRFSAGGTGEQGLLSLGDSRNSACIPTAIYIITNFVGSTGTVSAGISTTGGTFSVHVGTITFDTWYGVCLIYDGSTLTLVLKDIDNTVISSAETAASGVTLRVKCPLILGESFDTTAKQNFFNGYLDNWSLFNVADFKPWPQQPGDIVLAPCDYWPQSLVDEHSPIP